MCYKFVIRIQFCIHRWARTLTFLQKGQHSCTFCIIHNNNENLLFSSVIIFSRVFLDDSTFLEFYSWCNPRLTYFTAALEIFWNSSQFSYSLTSFPSHNWFKIFRFFIHFGISKEFAPEFHCNSLFIIYLSRVLCLSYSCLSSCHNCGTLCYSFSFNNHTDSGDEGEGLKREGYRWRDRKGTDCRGRVWRDFSLFKPYLINMNVHSATCSCYVELYKQWCTLADFFPNWNFRGVFSTLVLPFIFVPLPSVCLRFMSVIQQYIRINIRREE